MSSHLMIRKQTADQTLGSLAAHPCCDQPAPWWCWRWPQRTHHDYSGPDSDGDEDVTHGLLVVSHGPDRNRKDMGSAPGPPGLGLLLRGPSTVCHRLSAPWCLRKVVGSAEHRAHAPAHNNRGLHGLLITLAVPPQILIPAPTPS